MSRETASKDNPILIVTACASIDEAEKIANTLVQEKLVACAQIQGEMTSIYEWNGKNEMSKEIPLHLKTTSEHWDAVKRKISSLHSYEVPEIIALPILEISPEYHQWILGNVKKLVQA